MRALDLVRDPRFALHSGSDDPPAWDGEAKVAGTVRAETREGASSGRYHLFKADINEVVLICSNDARDKLVVGNWHGGRGLSRIER